MKLCRFWQLAADLAGESPGWLACRASIHREHCPACAQVWRASQRLARGLTLAAERPATPAPARLAARVAAGVALVERNRQLRPARNRFFPALASVLALAAVMMAAAWLRGPRPAAEFQSALSFSALEEVRTKLPLPSSERLQAASDTLERPLRAELEAMKADVRTVADYLSRNLLPKDLLATGQR